MSPSKTCFSITSLVKYKVLEGEIVLIEEQLIELVAKEISVKANIVKQVVALLDEGNTVPFIARYRKEVTGGLDEVSIKEIQDKWQYEVQLFERKATVTQ